MTSDQVWADIEAEIAGALERVEAVSSLLRDLPDSSRVDGAIGGAVPKIRGSLEELARSVRRAHLRA